MEIKIEKKTFTGIGKVQHEMCSFYWNIYSINDMKNENISTFLQHATCPKLNDQDQKYYDSLPAINEWTKTMNKWEKR